MSEYQVTPQHEQKWREEFENEFSRRFYESNGYYPASIIGGEAFEWYCIARAIDAQRIAELEAQIDRLMLEYCPDEMSPAQIENWGNHQKVSSFKLTNTTLPVLTWETAKRKGE